MTATRPATPLDAAPRPGTFGLGHPAIPTFLGITLTPEHGLLSRRLLDDGRILVMRWTPSVTIENAPAGMWGMGGPTAVLDGLELAGADVDGVACDWRVTEQDQDDCYRALEDDGVLLERIADWGGE